MLRRFQTSLKLKLEPDCLAKYMMTMNWSLFLFVFWTSAIVMVMTQGRNGDRGFSHSGFNSQSNTRYQNPRIPAQGFNSNIQRSDNPSIGAHQPFWRQPGYLESTTLRPVSGIQTTSHYRVSQNAQGHFSRRPLEGRNEFPGSNSRVDNTLSRGDGNIDALLAEALDASKPVHYF